MFALQTGISYDISMYNTPPREQARHYDIQWHRQTGVFYPEQLSGTPTAGVSANTWHEYMNLICQAMDLIRQAAADHPTHRLVLVSPELMTTAGMDLLEIPGQRDVVDDRLAKLEELSTSMPTAELVVGTPEYHPDGIYKFTTHLLLSKMVHAAYLSANARFLAQPSRGYSPQATHCSSGAPARYLLCVPI